MMRNNAVRGEAESLVGGFWSHAVAAICGAAIIVVFVPLQDEQDPVISGTFSKTVDASLVCRDVRAEEARK